MMTFGNLWNKFEVSSSKYVTLTLLLNVLFIIGSSELLKLNFNNSRENTSLKVVQITDTSWGYEIYINEKIFIKQLQIPCFPGNKEFKTYNDALLTGKIVLSKINAGLLPTLTKDEIIKLKIRI